MSKSQLNKLTSLIKKAKTSKFQLWLLNQVLAFSIPFNKPHGFKITQIKEAFVEISLKYKRVNLNHIRGIHACAIATASEFASGLVLLGELNPAEYRIIMKTIKIDYHYQAKQNIFSRCSIEPEEILSYKERLQNDDSILVDVRTETFDAEQNHISTAEITWQLKKWDKVSTAV